MTNPSPRSGLDSMSTLSSAPGRRLSATASLSCPGRRSLIKPRWGASSPGWNVDVGSGTFPAPTLIVVGRSDSVARYIDARDLLEPYPRSTFAVLRGRLYGLSGALALSLWSATSEIHSLKTRGRQVPPCLPPTAE
jgi:hypothetical protein